MDHNESSIRCTRHVPLHLVLPSVLWIAQDLVCLCQKKGGHLEVGGACQNNQKHKDPNFREEEKKRKGGR